MNTQHIAFTELVSLSGDQPVTDSRRVAKYFEKQHQHVLRDIRRIQADLPKDFNESNFGRLEILDARGRAQSIVTLTKDGFLLLAMGFTGKKALAIKLAFIHAFNDMVERLNSMGNFAEWQELVLKDKQSFTHASYGSALMHKRKKLLPQISSRLSALEQRVQMRLFDSAPQMNDAQVLALA